jgi:predicted dinucleotide-binding enzyme
VRIAVVGAGRIGGNLARLWSRTGAGEKPAPRQTVAQYNSGRIPGARYVRAFNTLTAGFQAQAAGRPHDERVVMFSAATSQRRSGSSPV